MQPLNQSVRHMGKQSLIGLSVIALVRPLCDPTSNLFSREKVIFNLFYCLDQAEKKLARKGKYFSPPD